MKLRIFSRPGPLCAHFWAYFRKDMQTFLDAIMTRTNDLLLPYETGKTAPVGNCCYCLPSAYLLERCQDAIMASYSLCLAQMEDPCWADHITTIFVKFLQLQKSMCLRKFVHTATTVLRGESALKQLFRAVDFTAQKDVSLIRRFIFTPSLDTGRDSQVCAAIWCQPTLCVVFIDVYRGLLCPLVV